MRITINDNLISQIQIDEIVEMLFKDKEEELQIVARKSTVNSSRYSDGKLLVEYVNKSYIFRSIFNYANGLNFNVKLTEKLLFDELSIMLDCSRNGVLNLEFAKKMIRLLSLMGYTSLQLYTEDTYEIEEEPYFGYLRGSFKKSELKMLDDYAYNYGIEIIPCIQTLAHLKTIFKWSEYKAIHDIDDILLVDNERTYLLIENMFKTINDCFRSKKVNIGMDEAFMLGLGNYYTKNGNSNRMKLMLRHLDVVSNIAKKYDYKCSMWSDMFYRLAFGGYYNEDYSTMDESVTDRIPDNIELIYWDYYSDNKEHFETIIKQHQVFKNNIWFAAGGWTFVGILPNNDFSILHVKATVSACKETNTLNYLMTLWNDNGNECCKLVTIPTLLYLAEYAYENCNDALIEEKFKRLTNLPVEAFMISEKLDKVGNVTKLEFTNPSKYLLYNDVLCGFYDTTIAIENGDEYKKIAKELKKYESDKEYGHIFKCHKDLALVLEKKVTLGKSLRKYYQEGNKEKLLELAKKDFKVLISRLEKYYESFYKLWISENRTFGFEVQNYRLGGLISRIKHCKKVVEDYCNGNVEKIEELEIKLLDFFGNKDEYTKGLGYFNLFDQSITVNAL